MSHPWLSCLPFLVLVLGTLITLVCEPFCRSRVSKHRILGWSTLLTLISSAVTFLIQGGGSVDVHGLLLFEPMRLGLALAVLTSAGIATAGLRQSLDRDQYPGGESYVLLLVATLGGLVLVHATHALSLFVAVEMVSLPIYALVGLRRHLKTSQEAMLKYFLMGSVFSAILLYGLALHYGATGGMGLGAMALTGREHLHFLAQVVIMTGLLFKLGAVPFHFWVADAYTGAPMAITGFMGAVVKIGGIAALSTIWLSMLHSGGVQGAADLSLAADLSVGLDVSHPVERFSLLILCVAMLSILLGNFAALGQTHLRRLLAYSSIAHVGYMLLAFALPSVFGLEPYNFSMAAVCYYVAAYAVAVSGCMTAFTVSDQPEDEDALSLLSGLGRRAPLAGVAATLCLLSLAGLPPTSGFLGKYLVFADLVRHGHTTVAIVAVLLAVVGAVYYLRIVVTLWATSDHQERLPMQGLTVLGLLLAMAAVLGLLIWPGVVLG